jgi:hypothetical protein
MKMIICPAVFLALLLEATFAKEYNRQLEGSVVCYVNGDANIQRPANDLAIRIPGDAIDLGYLDGVGYYLTPKLRVSPGSTVRLNFVNDRDSIVGRFDQTFTRADMRKNPMKVKTAPTSWKCEDLPTADAMALYRKSAPVSPFSNSITRRSPDESGVWKASGTATVAAITGFGVLILGAGGPNAGPEGEWKDSAISNTEATTKFTRVSPNPLPGPISRREFYVSTTSLGQNIAPISLFDNAAYWNPSALVLSEETIVNTQIKLLDMASLPVRLAWFHYFEDGFGIGGTFSCRYSKRSKSFESDSAWKIPDEDFFDKQAEFRVPFGMAFFQHEFAVGGAIKWRYANRTVANSVLKDRKITLHTPVTVGGLPTDYDGRRPYIDTTVRFSTDAHERGYSAWDLDASASWDINPYLRVGVSGIDLLGSASEVEENQSNGARLFGAGFSFAYGRFSTGVDMTATDKGQIDGAIGLNIELFEQAVLGGGLSTAFHSKELMLGYGGVNISLLDNDLHGRLVSVSVNYSY